MKKDAEAIAAILAFLESSPTDAEAWAELADLYVSQGLYQQGIFALEEVLLVTPNAWNVSTLVDFFEDNTRASDLIYLLFRFTRN